MKKLLAFVVAGMFSLSAAAYACDGAKMTKTQKTDSAKVAKKETKTPPAKTTTKKS